jgi:uncharacterized membrane protein YozB (DUF420 family)
MTKEQFALLNACLNGLSGLLLVIAYVAVKKKRYSLHGYLMGAAIVSSAVFLVCYLYSHYKFGERTSGLDHNWLYWLYLAILLPHILLAVVMLPPIFITVWFAYRRNWILHRRIARPTFWVWLYVSVTGVIIYWMLYHLFPTMIASGR